MSSPFAHTLRSLEVDGSRGARALVVLALVLFAGWLTWMTLAEVPVTEVSEDARVQIDAVGHELTVAVEGRILGVRARVGEQVAAGDVIVELDDKDTRLQLDQAQARVRSLELVVEQRERQIAAEREAIEAGERAGGAAADQARARVDKAIAAARLAESELAEIAALREAEIGTDAELRRSQAEADQLEAATRELRSAGRREQAEQVRDLRDRLATIVRVEGEIAELEVELASARAQLETLNAALDHHRIRAPVDGIVGELDAVERGSWLARGESVGVILPRSELEIVARFDPSAAIGRVEVGQPATLRLTGFPWTQYGSVSGEVSRVASELRAGKIHVEIAIRSVPDAISLEHGLPGTVEVEVERTNPATLLLRAAGRRLTGRGRPPSPTTPGPAPAEGAERGPQP